MRRCGAAGMVALICACSSSGSAPSVTGVQAFVGTWVRSGTIVITCPGQPATTDLLTGNLTIAVSPAGSTSLIAAMQPNGCVTDYTVSGNVATEVAGQSCSTTNDAGLQTVLTNRTHTLTLSADGHTITESGQGVLAETENGAIINCPDESSGTFAKQ